MADDLDWLRGVLEAATPGTWEADGDALWAPHGDADGGSCEVADRLISDRAEYDARAIVALHNAAPELLAVARAAEPWRRGERCCPSAEVAARRERGPCAPCVLAYAIDALDARLRGEREGT